MDMNLKLSLNINADTLTPTKKNLLLAGPPLVIVVLFAYLLIMPAFKERKALNEEIEKQGNDIASLQRSVIKLPAMIAENKSLETKLAGLQLQLPEENEISGLLKQVSELGIKSGLQIMSWRPGKKDVHSSKEVYQIPVNVTMRGTYHKFGQFFSNVTALNRIVNILNISMRPDGTALDVDFTAMTYSLIPEKEKKELQKKGGKKK